MRGDKAFVRDTGRVKAGKVVCSTGPTAGHNPKLRESDRGDPGITLYDGRVMGHMVEERAPSHFTRFHVQPSPSTKMVDGAAQESGLPFLLAPEQSREREREKERERERKRERETQQTERRTERGKCA